MQKYRGVCIKFLMSFKRFLCEFNINKNIKFYKFYRRCRNEIWTLIEQFIEQIISLNNLGQGKLNYVLDFYHQFQFTLKI